MRCAIVLALTCALTATLVAQTIPPTSSPNQSPEQLFAEENWPALLSAVEAAPARTADLNYYHGTALAKLGRMSEAREAFLAGYRTHPHDKRFPIELGGIEFLGKHYAKSADWLLIASKLSPTDAYVNDFLGSVFYLEGNLDAALKYWNRVDKPHIANVRSEPLPKVNPVLLDRTFAFAPSATLRASELSATENRLQGLDLFPDYSLALSARPDQSFDLTFHAQERNGFGKSKFASLLSTFRGVFYETVTPEYYNIGRDATNAQSLLRWDTQKRRASFALSGPLRNIPRLRYRLGADLRNENWDIRESFTGPAPTLASLNLRREAVSASITSFNSGRWSWFAAAELSHRDLRNVNPGSTLSPNLLLQGYELKQTTQLKYRLIFVPEKRFTSTANVSTETGRLFSQSTSAFFKPQASLSTHWYPRAQGDDLEMHHQLHVGDTIGDIPFDDLFMLGLERDNDLPMRAHIGTRDGRKGSAPLGRRFFLSNWEMDKNLYNNGLIAFKLGPFLDVGHITNGSNPIGPQKYLWDTGMQIKLSALGVKFVLSYGRDLRSGKGAFYVRSAIH